MSSSDDEMDGEFGYLDTEAEVIQRETVKEN